MRDETRPVEDEMIKWAMSDVAPMSDEAFGRGRAALLARMDAEPAPPAVVPFRRRRRRIPLVAAAAAMVLIAGAALITPSLMTRGKGPSVGSASAAELLNLAAGITGDAKLQPGQYLYVLQYARWSSRNSDYEWMYLQDQTLQTWIPADRGSTWMHRRNKTGDRQWLIGSEKDLPADLPPLEIEGEWRSDGGRWMGDKVPVSFRHPTPEYIAGLPRDPKALYEKLRDEASGNEGQNLLRMVTAGLDTGEYPADVRAAVFKALAHLPKLEILDKAAVLDSRSGTALGVTENETTEQIVIDPATGDYLGSRTVLAKDGHGLKKGELIGVTSITTRVVSAVGEPF